MAHIQARNVFRIDADKIRIEGRHAKDGEIDIETETGAKLRFNQPLDIDNSKGAFIQGKKGQQLIKDEAGNAIMEIKSDGNLKCLVPIDFNSQPAVNFSGGGGGGSNTTSHISSENLPGQTLENELDAINTSISTLTSGQTTQDTSIGTNTTNIATNTTNIATNTGNITTLTSTQGTQGTAITALQTTQTTQGNNITAIDTQQITNTTNIATNTGNITTLQTTQGTQGTAITALQTTQATQGTTITNNEGNITTITGEISTLQTTQAGLTTQQNLNTAAIASNTARTSNLTANKILISSATGTINTASIGVGDVASKNSSNDFKATGGGSATTNQFDAVSCSSVSNTGENDAVSYKQGGVALNFSHLAGSVDKADLPTESVRTDVADQTIQGQPTTSALTKMTIDNTHASGNSQFVIQKRSTLGVVEGGITIQQTTTGTNISTTAPVGNSPNISITPANGSLAMTIGGQDTRVHNNFKVLGSLSGSARSDQKEYVFKTDGTGAGGQLLVENLIQRPGAIPPTADSVVQLDATGTATYLEKSKILTKPGGADPTTTSFVAVQTGGGFTYVPSSFAPLPGGAFPGNGVENLLIVNPAGTSYSKRFNFLERPGGQNPTADSLLKISSAGVNSYVAETDLIKSNVGSQTISQTTGACSLVVQTDSATTTDDASIKILRTSGGVENNSIEFIPTHGGNTQWKCKNDLDIFINNQKKMGIGNHTTHIYKPMIMETGADIRLQQSFTAPTSATAAGVAGTIGFANNYLYICDATNSWRRIWTNTWS